MIYGLLENRQATHIVRQKVLLGDEVLASLGEAGEVLEAGVNLLAMFLVFCQQDLSPCHILGQLICCDDGCHLIAPSSAVTIAFLLFIAEARLVSNIYIDCVLFVKYIRDFMIIRSIQTIL